ncbi:MAG TPA: hypothetical protein VHX60_10445 [Acidobacteriaceae bacterium]|nr:hypothetical protein [Acidobacteriaceae bacterium]
MSYASVRLRQDSNLQPPALEAKYLLSAPPVRSYAEETDEDRTVIERPSK